MRVYKDRNLIIVDEKEVEIQDIAMISFKLDDNSYYYVEIDIDDKNSSKVGLMNISNREAKNCLNGLSESLIDNGVNTFYKMGNRLINFANVKSISTSRFKPRGKYHTIDIEFTNRSVTLITNKTIAERAIKDFENRFNQYTHSVALY